ncbi:hypothetical protein JIR001_25900 [Polycladomyces abyssicola]|uniref:Uncharacterized protein n=1 Tax=Polycladomyces abyssicola TaxID=1125966 RepID=A0A8D5UJ63_9BACL|nr:hypothetical protein [Polycladomyces abyssicola]BCU82807.1 hypothetical protein JIR001_25900 [Polycladomyces abyssicola]
MDLWSLRKLLVRKLIVASLLFVFCLIYFLFNSVVVGIEMMESIAYILIFGVPILFIYAPIISVVAELISQKYSKNRKSSKLLLSLVIHLIGGVILPTLAVAVTKPSDLPLMFNSVFSLFISLSAIVPAFLFWLVDLLWLDFISKKTNLSK